MEKVGVGEEAFHLIGAGADGGGEDLFTGVGVADAEGGKGDHFAGIVLGLLPFVEAGEEGRTALATDGAEFEGMVGGEE